jgi:hypothetical protein
MPESPFKKYRNKVETVQMGGLWIPPLEKSGDSLDEILDLTKEFTLTNC